MIWYEVRVNGKRFCVTTDKDQSEMIRLVNRGEVRVIDTGTKGGKK